MSRDLDRFDASKLTLTDAASEVLTNHLSSARDRILLEIERVRATDGRDGSVREEEVSEAIQRLAVVDARTHYLGILRRSNKLIPYAATLVAAILIAFIVNWTTGDLDRSGWVFAILGILMGLATNLAQEIFAERRRSQRSKRADKNRLFLERFGRLEIDARNYVAREAGLQSAEGSLGVVLATMLDRETWSSEDVNNFRLLLRLRNSLVHENIKMVSDDELVVALSQIERLRDRIPSFRIPWPSRGQERAPM